MSQQPIAQVLAQRYKIIKLIGRGAFGVTFLAEDMQRPGNPHCIVKQFQPIHTDENTLRIGKNLFDREAETLEKLGKHDQIPQLLAHFEENQQFYLIQEYIPGHDLTQEISPKSSQNLTEAETIKLLIEILEVLDFIHQQQHIHRDIKLSNIRRRSSDNKIVLIDFGAVKQVTTQVVNQNGNVRLTVGIGTPGYMPSEQSQGQPRFSSDVYAVGMIGIQAMTGVAAHLLPQSQNTSEIIWRQQAEVSDKFAAILDKMVRYDFRQRYLNADEALQDLQNLLPVQSNSNNIKIALPILGIVAVIAAGLGIGNLLNTPEKIEFAEYKNQELAIQIKYPESPQKWQLRKLAPIRGERVEFTVPNKDDNFQELVKVSIREYSGTLAESKQEFIREINTEYSQAKIVSESKVTLGLKTGYEIVFTSDNRGNELKHLQRWILQNDQVYIVNYSADVDDYNRFLSVAKEMMDSFRVESQISSLLLNKERGARQGGVRFRGLVEK
ncbi:serine/threonine protein kinase [Rivularia sp. PCC 7116]|uniref:serine/threonine-protein kinase n=1 Tax=Rivularia sp. PCC 7116 TaxID=373994 RepID=UPI00029F3CE6|nr:serine/threonine-protein kinase [Rivularia sp. PCC 7116]AFY56133.1 serine/threonine protein kinase [Rivularia sp. PCC 7116]